MTSGDQTGSALDERRTQILDAALKVFAERGLHGTKMSMIAAEAGISQGLPYRYFGSKEELFTLLVQQSLDAARSAVANLSALPGTPRQRFLSLTRTMLSDDHRLHFLLIQQAQAGDDVPAQVEHLVEQHSTEEMFSHLLPIFTQGQRLGEFCEGDPQRLLLLYFSVVAGLMLQATPVPPNHWAGEADILIKLLQ